MLYSINTAYEEVKRLSFKVYNLVSRGRPFHTTIQYNSIPLVIGNFSHPHTQACTIQTVSPGETSVRHIIVALGDLPYGAATNWRMQLYWQGTSQVPVYLGKEW